MTRRTIEDVQRQNQGIKQKWFDPDTMRFFRTVIESELIENRYFISSERYRTMSGAMEPKRFTVREAAPNGHISTVGAFRGHTTLGAAHRAIVRLLLEATKLDNEAAE